MPFTPYHLGIGALAKSVTPRWFSFQVFFLSQVLIDIEPGVGLIRGSEVLHGFTHTWSGALLLSLATFVVWKAWERFRPARYAMAVVVPPVIVGSALFGTLSHVFLDSLYHAEMAHLRLIDPDMAKWADLPTSVEALCLAALLLAGMMWGLRSLVGMTFRRFHKTKEIRQ